MLRFEKYHYSIHARLSILLVPLPYYYVTLVAEPYEVTKIHFGALRACGARIKIFFFRNLKSDEKGFPTRYRTPTGGTVRDLTIIII